jgi:hypothetical protein
MYWWLDSSGKKEEMDEGISCLTGENFGGVWLSGEAGSW